MMSVPVSRPKSALDHAPRGVLRGQAGHFVKELIHARRRIVLQIIKPASGAERRFVLFAAWFTFSGIALSGELQFLFCDSSDATDDVRA
jgi:hypothetical protein